MFQNEFQHFLKSGKTNYVKDELKKVQKVAPKMGSLGVKNEIAGLRQNLPRTYNNQVFFGGFFSGFGALWVLLGRLLGFLRVSWEVSGPKNIKNHRVF